MAGGKSSRFGSNKALSEYGGKTFLQCAISRLQPYVGELVVSGFYKEYENLNIPILKDDIADIGALGGIYTALKHCHTPWILVLTCDMPMISNGLIERMLVNAQDKKVIAWKHDKSVGVFPILISKDMLADVGDMIDNERYRVKQLFDRADAELINVPEEWKDCFANINRKEDVNVLM